MVANLARLRAWVRVARKTSQNFSRKLGFDLDLVYFFFFESQLVRMKEGKGTSRRNYVRSVPEQKNHD